MRKQHRARKISQAPERATRATPLAEGTAAPAHSAAPTQLFPSGTKGHCPGSSGPSALRGPDGGSPRVYTPHCKTRWHLQAWRSTPGRGSFPALRRVPCGPHAEASGSPQKHGCSFCFRASGRPRRHADGLEPALQGTDTVGATVDISPSTTARTSYDGYATRAASVRREGQADLQASRLPSFRDLISRYLVPIPLPSVRTGRVTLLMC